MKLASTSMLRMRQRTIVGLLLDIIITTCQLSNPYTTHARKLQQI